MAQPIPPRLLTTQEVADLCHVSRMAVTRWADKGDLAFVRLPSGHRRFRPDDVERLLDPVKQAAS